MQDIRPMPKKPSSGMPIPPEDELYEISREAKRKRFSGSPVPVANVHVEEKSPRPLFAKTPLDKPIVRLGQRERLIIFILLGVVALVGLLAAAIFLPRAEITLVLRTAPLLVDQELTVRAQETEATNTVPGAGFFRQISVEGSIPVISTEMVGTKATGIVDIVNKTSEEQKIREKSRLVTKDGMLFYMQQAVFVPGGGSKSVSATAAESGEAGNISPQRLNFAALDASAQSVLYAEVTKAFSGGTGEEIHVVHDEDTTRAKEAAEQAAQDKVRGEIEKDLPRGWALLDESWSAELSDFKTDGDVGAKQPELAYTGQATVRVLGYETAKLEDRLKMALQSRLDKDYALFPGPISYSKSVKSVDWEKGEGVMVARVTHTTIPDFSLPTLKQKIANRTGEDAEKYLEGLPGVQSVDLKLAPFWVQSIPRIESRIDLKLVPERQP